MRFSSTSRNNHRIGSWKHIPRAAGTRSSRLARTLDMATIAQTATFPRGGVHTVNVPDVPVGGEICSYVLTEGPHSCKGSLHARLISVITKSTAYSVQAKRFPVAPRDMLRLAAPKHSQQTGSLKNVDIMNRRSIPRKPLGPIEQDRLDKGGIPLTFAGP